MVSASDSTASHGYVAAYPWSERLNEPPRVPIPPPNIDFSQGQPSITVQYPTSMDYDSSQFGNPAFLQALITSGSVTLSHKLLDWKYENRRQAQVVLPFLYLGPLSAAKDERFVSEAGFTFVMSVRSTGSGLTRAMDAGQIAARYYGIQSYNLDLDSPTDLIRKSPTAIKAINDHLQDTANTRALPAHEKFSSSWIPGKVFIFCETGNERSAAFVTAYLMAVFNVDLITAIQTVQSQRFSICLDDPTKSALSTFETLLSAKRAVGRANKDLNAYQRRESLQPQTLQQTAISTRSKRTLDDFYDDEEAMDTHDWEPTQGHERRIGGAPFYDTKE